MGADPITIAALAVAIAGTLSSGAMAYQQAQVQAKTQEQQADFARKQSEIDANEFRRKQRRLLGTARATRGATGVDLLSGSPLLVDDETIDEIVFQTERVRQGGDITATRLEQQASFTRAEGTSALAGSVLKAGGTFLTSDAGSSMFGSSPPVTGPATVSGGTLFM
jgi:hypothetical protein